MKTKNLLFHLAVIGCLVISLSARAQQSLWGTYPDAFYNLWTSSVNNNYQEVLKDVDLGPWPGLFQMGPDNTLYGVTSAGVIYKYIPGNAKPSLVFKANTVSSISITDIDYNAGYIYGNCTTSGESGIYRVRLDGTDFTILRANDSTGHGRYDLQVRIDDKLYGLRQPSTTGYQIYFSIKADGSDYTEIRNFPDPTKRPNALSYKTGDYKFTATSYSGGSCGRGAVFWLTIDGAEFNKLIDFRGTGFDCGGAGAPYEDILAISDGANPIYVTSSHEDFQQTYILTENGGTGENGKLVSLAPDGYSDILDFGFGSRPSGPIAVLPDGKVLGICGKQGDLSGKIFMYDPREDIRKFDIILDFESEPQLVSLPSDIKLGTDGRIYGTSFWASFQNLEKGTIFSFKGDGTDLQRHYYFEHNFGPNDIVYQDSTLIGMFRNSIAIPVPSETGYTTGSLFRYDEDGLKNIYIFPRFDADSTKLSSGSDGFVYGVNAPRQFMIKVKTDGSSDQRTSLPEFKSDARLSVTASGIYGTSYGNDTYPDGFIYKVRSDFSGIDVIYSFSSPTGTKPRGTLVEFGGELYGLTSAGGSYGNGVVFKVQPNGTGYTVLHDFDGTSGGKPYGGLTLTSTLTGTFHGMASAGGANNLGVIFRINSDGTGFQKVFDFNFASGGAPKDDFVRAPGNALYAMTTTGAAFGHGAVFSFFPSSATYVKLKDHEKQPLQNLVLVPGEVGPLSHVISPEDGALDVSSNTEIELHKVPEATLYNVELSLVGDFSSDVIKKTFTTNKGYFEGLGYETTYFARVSTNITPSYGPVTHFTTHAPNGDAYVITPADSAEFIAVNNLAVTANLVTGATTYTIELNTTPDFTGTSFVQSSSTPGERTLIFNGLSNVTRYYARVRTDLSPAWGSTTTFRTVGTESYLIAPADNETGVTYTTTLQFQPVAGASRYYLVLDYTRANGDTGTQAINHDGTTMNLSGLVYSAEYKARIKTDVNPDYGPVTTFYTVPAIVDTYVVSPVNGAINVPTTIEVHSNIVGEAKDYTVELNTSPDFTGTSFVQSNHALYAWIFTFTGLAPSTTYYSRVKTNLSPDWGETRSFTTTSASVVSIIDPIDNKTEVSVKPIVKISPVSGATEYTLQLSETSDFTSSVTTFTSASVNIQTAPLKYSTLYYVRAKSNVNLSYGSISRFTTHAPNKYAFVSNPVDGASNVAANNLQVTANIVYGATEYVIELNTDPNFIGTSIIRTSAVPGQRTMTFTGLAAGTVYYSRVKTNMTSLYGPVRSFTTIAQPVHITQPANNATEVVVTSPVRTTLVPPATTYTLEVSGTGDFNGPIATYTSSTPVFSLGYLSYSTRYYMRVKTNLTDYGMVTTFITHAAEKFSFVSSPVNGATNVGTVNVQITANIVYGATSYTIELNTSPDFTGTSIVRSSAVFNQRSIIFDALQPGTTYYNRTRTNLPSDWGPVRSFTTASLPPAPLAQAAQEDGRIRIYPNPFVSTFTTEVHEGTNVNVAVFDVTGKQIINESTSKGKSLQLGDELSKGVYILRIQDGANVTIHRMIKH